MPCFLHLLCRYKRLTSASFSLTQFFIALLDGLEAHASMFHYNGAGAEPIATVGKMVQEGVTDADEDSIAEGLTSSLSSSEAFTSRQSAADEDGVCTEELNFDRTPDAPETFPNVAAMGHSKAGMAGEVLSQTPHLPTKSASFVKSVRKDMQEFEEIILFKSRPPPSSSLLSTPYFPPSSLLVLFLSLLPFS